MAEKKIQTAATKAPKRRLKSAPSLREQASKTASKAKKPSKVKKFFESKLFTPFREIGAVFKLIWRSRVFTPVRVVFRFLGCILAPAYIRNSVKEMKNVTWPGFSLSWKLTIAVLIFAISFGLLIAGLDFVFEKLFREVLLG